VEYGKKITRNNYRFTRLINRFCFIRWVQTKKTKNSITSV